MGWDEDGLGVPVEGWALLQAGSCKSLPAAQKRLWCQCHSQRRKLLPSPNSQSNCLIESSCLSCGNTGTASQHQLWALVKLAQPPQI